jgi:hypothetical protein
MLKNAGSANLETHSLFLNAKEHSAVLTKEVLTNEEGTPVAVAPLSSSRR